MNNGQSIDLQALTDSTNPIPWRCDNCGNLILRIYKMGEGTLEEHKCRNCNLFNFVEKTDEGALRFFSSLHFASTTAVTVPVSA